MLTTEVAAAAPGDRQPAHRHQGRGRAAASAHDRASSARSRGREDDEGAGREVRDGGPGDAAARRAERLAQRDSISAAARPAATLERELKISELQRQIDVATGKITPEQARKAGETERINVLATEVERLRRETGSARTASKEEVERLRQLQDRASSARGRGRKDDAGAGREGRGGGSGDADARRAERPALRARSPQPPRPAPTWSSSARSPSCSGRSMSPPARSRRSRRARRPRPSGSTC